MESDPQTFQIIGAAMEVHHQLGPSQRDLVYRAALAEELSERGIPVERDLDLSFTYKEKPVACTDVSFDLTCFENLLVGIRTVPKLIAEDETELRADLVEAGFERGLLLNFARLRLEIKRVLRDAPAPPEKAATKKPKPEKENHL